MSSIATDFELIEKYAIFASLCDALCVIELVQNDQRLIRTKMMTSPRNFKDVQFDPLKF